MAVKVCKRFLVLTIVLSFVALAAWTTPAISSAGDIDKAAADLENSEWQTRLKGVETLGTMMKNERALDLLLKVADSRQEYWPVKIKAMLLIGESKDPRAIEVLLRVFNDTFLHNECPSIKSFAAIALGNFNDDRRVVDTLITGLTDGEVLTREACVDSLGKIKNARAVPYLIPLLNDKSDAVKLSTIRALEKIGDTQAVPHLKKVAENSGDKVVRDQARLALNNFK